MFQKKFKLNKGSILLQIRINYHKWMLINNGVHISICLAIINLLLILDHNKGKVKSINGNKKC